MVRSTTTLGCKSIDAKLLQTRSSKLALESLLIALAKSKYSKMTRTFSEKLAM